MSDPLANPLVDSFLFHPRPARPGSSRLKGVSDGTFPAEEGVALGYRLYASQPGQPVIVYFHGNGEIAADHEDIAPLYHHAGASLLVVDYRGYGWSTGKPSAATLLPDSEAAYRALPGILDGAGLGGSSRFVIGRSLGSACAIHLASAHPADWRGLIIESGFAQVGPLLARLGLPVMIAPGDDPIGSLDKVRRLDLPLLVMHGERDNLIPVGEGQALYDASPAKVKTIRRFPGAGHNDLLVYAEEYFDAIRDFLSIA